MIKVKASEMEGELPFKASTHPVHRDLLQAAIFGYRIKKPLSEFHAISLLFLIFFVTAHVFQTHTNWDAGIAEGRWADPPT